MYGPLGSNLRLRLFCHPIMLIRLKWKAAPRYYFVFMVLLCSVLFFFKIFFSVPQYPRNLAVSPKSPATPHHDFVAEIRDFASVVSRTPLLRSVFKKLHSDPNHLSPTAENRLDTKAARISRAVNGATTKRESKSKLTLFVAIISAPIRIDRREGIRTTWMNDCRLPGVACRFFTDPLSQMKPHVADVLLNESRTKGDLEFMQVPRGYNFGRRMYWLIQWVTQKYEFDYLLRVDDDYFVCLRRLLFELHWRPPKRLYWGHVHCAVEGLVRVDEGFLILSSDLVHEFLARKETLLCHPFGDQTVALWINEAKNVTYFHDPRVHHEVTSLKPEFKVQREICQTYLSLHGAYLHEMLTYWDIVSKENRTKFWIPSVEPLSDICPLSTRFDWRAMQGPPYGWEPKPCSLNPVWDLGEMHRGRNMM